MCVCVCVRAHVCLDFHYDNLFLNNEHKYGKTKHIKWTNILKQSTARQGQCFGNCVLKHILPKQQNLDRAAEQQQRDFQSKVWTEAWLIYQHRSGNCFHELTVHTVIQVTEHNVVSSLILQIPKKVRVFVFYLHTWIMSNNMNNKLEHYQ